MNERYPTQDDLDSLRSIYTKLKCKGIAFVDEYGAYERICSRWSFKELGDWMINWSAINTFRNPFGELVISLEK